MYEKVYQKTVAVKSSYYECKTFYIPFNLSQKMGLKTFEKMLR